MTPEEKECLDICLKLQSKDEYYQGKFDYWYYGKEPTPWRKIRRFYKEVKEVTKIEIKNLQDEIIQLKEELKKQRVCSDLLYRFSDHSKRCVNYEELQSRGFVCECGYDKAKMLYEEIQEQRKIIL